MLPVNTYVLWDETKEAVVIDAGCYTAAEKEQLKDFIVSNELRVVHLLNTHLHFDHVFGNRFMLEAFGIKAEAHEADLPWLENLEEKVRMFGIYHGIRGCEPPVELGTRLNEGDVVTFGNHRFTLFHIPGHSLGSLVYYCAEEGIMFTGDVLFKQSIGRCDIGGGTEEQLIAGIKQKLLPLPPETMVFPGHGPHTTLAEEAKYNIYLQ